MAKSKGIGERILRLDRRIIATIALAAIVWPLVYPIGLPLAMNKYTEYTFDLVEKNPEGSVAIVEANFDTGYFGSLGPGLTAVLEHLILKKYKIVAYALHIEGPIVFWLCWNAIPKDLRDQYEYGKDWVFLGYMTGGETAQIKAAEDLKGLYSYDYFGTPLKELPLLDNINSIDDYDLIVGAFRGGEIRGHTYRIWGETFDKDLLEISQKPEIPVNIFDAGIIDGYVRGTRGAAEYEALLRMPGAGLAMMDAVSLFFTWLIIAVVIGNIGFYLQKMEAEVR